jgi:hypothetical protein
MASSLVNALHFDFPTMDTPLTPKAIGTMEEPLTPKEPGTTDVPVTPDESGVTFPTL